MCNQVKEVFTIPDYNRGTYECPFCGSMSYIEDIAEIKHDVDCEYLIAKDLSTNF